MSDFAPTTEEMQSYYVSGRAQIRRQITGVRAQDITPFLHEFDRWLAAHDAVRRAEWEAERRAGDEATRRQIDGLASDYYEAIIRAERAEQGETEWEYGVGLSPSPGFIFPWPKLVDAQRMASLNPDHDATYFRRRKAGPWIAVPDTTNTEGRAEHNHDRMGICTRCGHGITARELLDGDEQCTTNNESEGDK